MESYLIILASPIYSWYLPVSLKNVLDRFVYVMCKYYGEEKDPSLWRDEKLGLIITCGYLLDKGADLFVEGMKRYAKHNQLFFVDWYGERHMVYDHEFIDEDNENRSREFVRKID